jgi:adenylylsulfate kinase
MVEIFCNTPLEVCEQRDVKGFYARARRGEILNYTGISSPYEVPMDADIEIDTSRSSVQESVALIVAFLRGRSVLR